VILCCDTSTANSVFAVGRPDGTLVASSTVFHGHNLSVRLFSDLDVVLAKADIEFDQIDTLAVGLGPGSFTGVRVAVTTFRTLAQATGKRLIGIDTLSIFAHALAGSAAKNSAIIPVMQSRRGEVYAAVFVDGREERAPFAATFAELEALLNDMRNRCDVVFTGIDGLLPDQFSSVTYVSAPAVPAESFLRLAAEALAAGRFANPFSLNPLYVVPPAVNQHKDPRTALRLAGLPQERV